MEECDGTDCDGRCWFQNIINDALDPKVSPTLLKSFSPLKFGEPQLRYHINILRKSGASLDVNSDRVKSNEKAKEYRNNGNDLFSSNEDPTKAAEMYTKSIAYALPGSRELALAYANRSAVSFKAKNYEDCLIDIERSLENGYPEEMRAKLYARRVRCLVVLKKPRADIEEALEDTRDALLKMDRKASGRDLVEKTLNDENHMAPAMSTKKTIKKWKSTIQDDSCDIPGATAITIQYSEKYGRHMVATRDIRPGEIIAVIDPYVTAMNPDRFYRDCAHCTKATTVGIPCYHCVNVIYCSSSCQDKAWNEYHEIECPIFGILLYLKFPMNAILGVKMTLKALKEAGNIIELKTMLEEIDSTSDPRVKGFTGDVFDCTKYSCIYTLSYHAGKHANQSHLMSLVSTFTIYYLATLTDIFGQKYPSSLEIFDENPLLIFLGELLMKNCEIQHINSCRVGQGKYLQIVPFTGLCNHSCDSNMTYAAGNKCIAFALQPIKAGDQICDNYGGRHFSCYPKAERQKVLKNYYFFTCDCVPCTKNWPVYAKLPSVNDMPGLSPAIRSQVSDLRANFLRDHLLGKMIGDVLAPKDGVIQLLELLYEHACPCKEMVTARDWLRGIYSEGLDCS